MPLSNRKTTTQTKRMCVNYSWWYNNTPLQKPFSLKTSSLKGLIADLIRQLIPTCVSSQLSTQFGNPPDLTAIFLYPQRRIHTLWATILTDDDRVTAYYPTGHNAAFVTRVLSCCWNRNDTIGSSLPWYGPVRSLSFPLDLAVVHIHLLETPTVVLFNRRTDEPCAHITCRTLVVIPLTTSRLREFSKCLNKRVFTWYTNLPTDFVATLDNMWSSFMDIFYVAKKLRVADLIK